MSFNSSPVNPPQLMEGCEAMSVLIGQCATDLMCLCAGTHDQKPHGAGDTSASAQDRHALLLTNSRNNGHFQCGGGQGRRRKHECKQDHDQRECALHVATSFLHAPRGIRATHATASQCPSARGDAPDRARYLRHVALMLASTTNSGALA